MEQILICATCRELATENTEYYHLSSDPTALNDVSLKEKLLYCVPEFEEVLSGDDENSWICKDCCQALCWAYGFRKMCLEVKSKLEMYFNDSELCVKEETFDIEQEEANFIHIKKEPEVFSDDDCTYTLVEIEEPDPLDIQSEEHALLQHACNTIPELKEKNISPESFKCQVKLERLNIRKAFRRRSGKWPFNANSVKGVFCSICTTGFRSSSSLIRHLRTQHNKTVSNEQQKEENCIIKVALRSNHGIQVETLHIDLIADKLESLTISDSRRAQGPVLSQIHKSSQKKEDKISIATKTETPQLLRETVFNLKENDTSTIDICETNPHGNFGICTIPSYPTFGTIRIHPERSFVGEEVLDKKMTDYVLSILRESNPNAVMWLPAASEVYDPRRLLNKPRKRKKTKPSDHTYSLFSRKFKEKCLECGWTFDMVELIDYHVETYHSGWFLREATSMNLRTRVWEMYYKNVDSEGADSALSDHEEKLGNNTQQKKLRNRKNSEIDGKSKSKIPDSDTETADEEEIQRNTAEEKDLEDVYTTEKQAEEELCSVQETEQLLDPLENCESLNVHVLHTTAEEKIQRNEKEEKDVESVYIIENQAVEELCSVQEPEKLLDPLENCKSLNVHVLQTTAEGKIQRNEKEEKDVESVYIVENQAVEELCSIQEPENLLDPLENCERLDGHVLQTTDQIKGVETYNSEQFSIIKPVEQESLNESPSKKVIVHQVQIFKDGVEVRGQKTLDLLASKKEESMMENLKPIDENIQQEPSKGCIKGFNFQRKLVPLEKPPTEPHAVEENLNKVHNNLDQVIVHEQISPIVLQTETIQGNTNENNLKKRLDHEKLALTPDNTRIVCNENTSAQVQHAKEAPNKLESVKQQESIPILIQQQQKLPHGENVSPLLGGPPLHLLSSTAVPQQNQQQPLFLLVNPSPTTNQTPLLLTTNNTPIEQLVNVVPDAKASKRKKKKKTRVRTYYILSTPDNPNSNVVLVAVPNDQNQVVGNEVQPSTSNGLTMILPLPPNRPRTILPKAPVKDGDIVVGNPQKELANQFLFVANKEQENAISMQACSSSKSKDIYKTLVEKSYGGNLLKRNMDDDSDSGSKNKKLKTCDSATEETGYYNITDVIGYYGLNEYLCHKNVDTLLSLRNEGDEKMEDGDQKLDTTFDEVYVLDEKTGELKKRVTSENEMTDEAVLDINAMELKTNEHIESVEQSLKEETPETATKDEMTVETPLDINAMELKSNKHIESVEQSLKEGTSETATKDEMTLEKPLDINVMELKSNKHMESVEQSLKEETSETANKDEMTAERTIDPNAMELKRIKHIESVEQSLKEGTSETATKDEMSLEKIDINAMELKSNKHIESVQQSLKEDTSEAATKDELKEKVIDAVDEKVELPTDSSEADKQLSETPLQDSEKLQHLCDVCNRTFTDIYALNLHTLEHKYEKPMEEMMNETQK